MKRLLILEREDVQRGLKNLPITDIDNRVFNFESYQAIKTYDMVLFRDLDGSIKIIKSRYPIVNENEIF